MTEYTLTAEEVLYMAAVVGADTFYGVQDTLSGLSDQELRLKIVEIENSLSQKEYLKEDFDANRHILQELLEVIVFCANCERLLSFEKEQIGEPQYACTYFMQGNEAYKMGHGKDAYIFSAITAGDIRNEIEQGLAVTTRPQEAAEDFFVRYEILEKAGTLARRGSAQKGEELLRESGASAFVAQEIINGILSKVDFYALLFMDFRNEKEPGYSVQYLAGTGLLVMEYETEEDEDYIRFRTVSEEELQKRLQTGFDKIECQEERQEFM